MQRRKMIKTTGTDVLTNLTKNMVEGCRNCGFTRVKLETISKLKFGTFSKRSFVGWPANTRVWYRNARLYTKSSKL